MSATVHIVGGGLAGTEAAWQLAARGVRVILYEMRPTKATPAHKSSLLAELVCSNSLKSESLPSPQALLKEELKLLDCALLCIAKKTRVPAGRSLSVDRKHFAEAVTQAVESHSLIEVKRLEVKNISDVGRPLILAAGPLASPSLAASLEQELGAENLFFFDAISPIIEASSIDFSKLFLADRYSDAGGDYWNIPLDRERYSELVKELQAAESAFDREWEKVEYFDGCLPLEEIARRGKDSLAFGPFRPVGLRQPGGERSYAVIQLRRENLAGNCYNLVGCQTNLPFNKQRELFRKLPGLENVAFLRYGQLHRNTYVNSPRILSDDLSLNSKPDVRVAGQLCGVEGYMESIATGLLAGLFVFQDLSGCSPIVPPVETMMGALCRHVSDADEPFQPMNANYGLLPSPPPYLRGRKARREWHCQRALSEFEKWKDRSPCF